MTPEEIIDQAISEGLILTLSDDGNIKVAGDQSIIDKWLPLLREYKSGIVDLLKIELKQQRVREMLTADPNKKYAILVDDAESDPVVVTVGIRGLATFELHIPLVRYDGIALLQVLDEYASETDLNSIGEANPLPIVNECNPEAHSKPQRRAA